MAAVRAAYVVVFLGSLAGLALATAILAGGHGRPATVAAALGLDAPDPPGLARRRAIAVATLTAECMARLGLTWAPIPDPEPTIPDPDLDPVAWADRWGFGISTTIGTPPSVADPDANLAALAGASDATRDRYAVALDGGEGRGGCRTTATETVHGLRDRLLTPLRGALAALDRAIAADPRIAAAAADWARCVAPVAGGLAPDRRTLAPTLTTDIARALSTSRPLARHLRRIREEERRVAGRLARCEVAYASRRAAVAARHEAAFVAAHRVALEAIGTAIRAAEATLPQPGSSPSWRAVGLSPGSAAGSPSLGPGSTAGSPSLGP
jgi:hypothetical protein